MYTWRPAILILFLSMVLLIPSPVYGGYEVYPSLDTNSFIMYRESSEDTSGVASINVFPPSFRIQYTAEYDVIVNWWWDPLCDPATYKYKVNSKQYNYTVLPPQIIEYEGARILLTYFTSVSVIPYASKTWWGAMEEHVKITSSVYVYGRIDNPPPNPMTLDLGSLIGEYVGGDRIVLEFSTEVERTEPDTAIYTVSGSFDLMLTGLELSFYELYTENIEVETYSARGIGGYEEEGFLLIAPIGSISVDLCLAGEPGYQLAGTLRYTNKYSQTEAEVVLESGGCTSAVLDEAILIPGNYSGRNKFVITFRSGALVVNIKSDAEVTGTMSAVSQPMVVLVPNTTEEGYTKWSAEVYVGVDYRAYMYTSPVYVSARGSITIGDVTRSFSCPTTEFLDRGVYKCTINLGNIGVEPSEVDTATASVTVTLTQGYSGISIEDTAEVDCTIISPVSTHGVVALMYRMVSGLTLAMIVGMVFLFLINYLSGHLMTRHLIDPYHINQCLMTSVVIASVVYGLPYFHWFIVKLVYSVPEFQSSLSLTPISDPDQLLTMPPDKAIAVLMSYYDLTLIEMRTLYTLWFDLQLGLHLLTRLMGLSVAIVSLIALSLLLTSSMNSLTAGAVLLPFVSLLLTVISMMVMMTPMAGIVQALIALAEFFITATALLFMTLMIFGVVLAVLPSPTATRFAEDFLGAGILYLIGVPAFAPLIYAVYAYVVQTINHYISLIDGAFPLDISLLTISVNLLIPIAPIMRMISCLTIITIISAMIILMQTYLLSRTGAMRGLGEGLLRITRR